MWKSISFRVALIAIVPVTLLSALMFISSDRTMAVIETSLQDAESRENSQFEFQKELLSIQEQAEAMVRLSGAYHVWIGNLLLSHLVVSEQEFKQRQLGLANQTKALAKEMKSLDDHVHRTGWTAGDTGGQESFYQGIPHRSKLVLRLSHSLLYWQQKTAEANERTFAFIQRDQSSAAISNYRYESQPLSGRLDESLKRMNSILGGITRDIHSQLQSLAHDAQAATRGQLHAKFARDRTLAWLLALLVGIVGIAYGVMGLSRPLRKLARAMSDAASGDCDPLIPNYRGGELGDMTEALRKFVQLHISQKTLASRVRGTSETLLSGMREIRESNGSLADRTQEQAAATESFAETLSSMKDAVDSTLGLAKKSGQLVNATTDSGTKSIEMAQNAVVAMGSIKASSQKITTIVSTVQELAFMTQLLSLNAAVEAARAGHHGQGFAVVAEEVSSLALRSSAAATEISELVQSSVDQISQGAELVEDSERLLRAMIVDLSSLGGASQEVHLGAQEQADQVNELVSSITQIDASTRKNTAFVETLFATASELERGMGQLNAALDDLS